ncbi:MAG: hypothetical protein AAFR96_10835 [Planctomycetota bacterium]
MNDQSESQHNDEAARGPDTPTPARRLLRTGLQLLGFCVGLGMLVWCVRIALSENNRDAIASLRDADTLPLIGLAAVVFFGVTISGVLFWLTLYRVRRLHPVDVVSTSYVAILLSYLPFKLSVLFRLAVHRQRDGVPLTLIAPWFGAVGLVLFIPVLPVVGFSILRPQVDIIWLAINAAAVLMLAWVTSALSSKIGGGRGLGLARRIADRQPIGLVRRAAHSDAFARFDESLTMLSDFKHVLLLTLVRVADMVAFALRFVIVARIIGEPMGFDDALIGSTVYFFIGVFFPFGALGAREAGTAGFLAQFSSIDFDQLAAVAVVVTGAELIIIMLCAAFGVAWLRPDRLLRAGRSAQGDAP